MCRSKINTNYKVGIFMSRHRTSGDKSSDVEFWNALALDAADKLCPQGALKALRGVLLKKHIERLSTCAVVLRCSAKDNLSFQPICEVGAVPHQSTQITTTQRGAAKRCR